MQTVIGHKEDHLALFDVLLHQGITEYKPIGSKASLLNQVEAAKQDKLSKKGAIFVVRNKGDFTDHGVKGYIITSKETLLANAPELSHFTPNVYRTYTYKDSARRYIQGFEERNLLQINTFVVDIDTHKYSREDILMACLEESIGLPTLIVATTRGYQVYFVLAEPLFISNKNDFRGLKVAKRISDNLKRSLKSVEADPFCNDFGFFRVPKPSNIVFSQLDMTYSMAEFMNWSMHCDDDIERSLFVVPSKMQVTSLTQSEWFNELLHATDIKGEKGQMGRNNVLFTLALVCFQDGKDQSFAFDLLDQFNTNLRYPLSTKEVNTIIASAYSGKYKGAKKEYVEQLLALYVGEDVPVHFGNKTWYKHKKAREDRERSHYAEREADLIAWMTAEKSVSEPFIWRTQKEICEAVNMASSTLNELIKGSKTIIKTTTGKGRNAKTGLTTVALYIEYIIWLKQDLGTRLAASLRPIVEEHIALMEPSAGYMTLTYYVPKLLKEQLRTEQLSMSAACLHTG